MASSRLELGLYPTPLEEMPRLRAALGGGPRLFIKRDDLTGPGFGGNKVRKLEYELAEAVAAGCDTILTTGGETSNHCRITAAICAKLGLDCVLILNRGQRGGTPASLYLDELYGARIHHVALRAERAPAMERLAGELRAEGRKPYVIPLGASTTTGARGYVDAVAELKSQLGERRIGAIIHSTSSGGTQAGLLAGLAIHNLPCRLVGVSADDPAADIAATVARIAEPLRSGLPAPVVDDGFVGGGYGVPTEESEAAIALVARTEGIVLDPTYTAKAMACLLARIREDEFREDQSIVFWHTGGQLGLFQRARVSTAEAISLLAHELRQPLGVIGTLTYLLTGNEPEHVALIQQQAEEADAIISDAFYWSNAGAATIMACDVTPEGLPPLPRALADRKQIDHLLRSVTACFDLLSKQAPRVTASVSDVIEFRIATAGITEAFDPADLFTPGSRHLPSGRGFAFAAARQIALANGASFSVHRTDGVIEAILRLRIASTNST